MKQNTKISIVIFLLAILLFSGTMFGDVVDDRLDDIVNDALSFYGPIQNDPTGALGYALAATHKGIDLTTANNDILWVHDINNVPDDDSWDFNIYWNMSMVLRLYLDPTCYNNLTPASRDDLQDILWRYINHRSKVSDAELSVWEFNNTISENHDAMRKVVFLLGAQALEASGVPYGPDRYLADGKTIRQHHQAWQNYWCEYFRQRAKEGVNCEIASPIYAKHTIHTYYNICDLTNNMTLSNLAGRFLDLYWADVASDYLQVTGLRGGAETRCYKSEYLTQGSIQNTHGFRHLTYAYDWHDVDVSNQPQATMLIAALSTYRVPGIITACASTSNKNPFIYSSRRFGRGISWDGSHTVEFDGNNNQSNLRRDTYVTPDYVMGTLSLNQAKSYTNMINQNRAMGVFFANNVDDRVVIHGQAAEWNDYKGYNEIHGVCGINCMAVARDTASKNGQCNIGTRIFISNGNLWNNRVESGGWFFSYSGNAYIAIKVATGTTSPYYTITPVTDGVMLDLQDMWAPIIIQTGKAEDYSQMFSLFRNSVRSNSFVYSQGQLTYLSENEDKYEIWRENPNIPKINNTTVDLNPEKTYDSPYISGCHGSDTVKVMYPGYEDIVLDFDYIDSQMWDDYQTIGLWHMDSVSNGKIVDDDLENNGRNRDLTLYGGLNVTTGGSGRFGEALDFDGVDDCAITFNWPSKNSVKIDFWFKADNVSGYKTLINAHNIWEIRMAGDDVYFYIWKADGNARYAAIQNIVGTSRWQHCRASVDAEGRMSITVDDTSSASVGEPMISQSAELKVGNKTGQTRWFDGKIDDLKIRTDIPVSEIGCGISISNGDFDGNCVVDFLDLTKITDDWLSFDNEFPCALEGDLNNDCFINILDLAVIANYWLECAWSPQTYCN